MEHELSPEAKEKLLEALTFIALEVHRNVKCLAVIVDVRFGANTISGAAMSRIEIKTMGADVSAQQKPKPVDHAANQTEAENVLKDTVEKRRLEMQQEPQQEKKEEGA
jgi:hypothetical protein